MPKLTLTISSCFNSQLPQITWKNKTQNSCHFHKVPHFISPMQCLGGLFSGFCNVSKDNNGVRQKFNLAVVWHVALWYIWLSSLLALKQSLHSLVPPFIMTLQCLLHYTRTGHFIQIGRYDIRFSC